MALAASVHMHSRQQALHVLLTHTPEPELLCICSSISQQLHQAVKATVLGGIAHLLVAVLQDKRGYERQTIEALQWLCTTAGPAALQSGNVVGAVLVGFAGLNREFATRAGAVLLEQGLHLTDRLLTDAARQRIRHLDTLVAATDDLILQQQQQQPSAMTQLSLLYRLAVAGGADELTAEVNRLLSGAVGADQLADLMYILCNREQQIVPAFQPLLFRCIELQRLAEHTATVAAEATRHNDSSTAINYPAAHDSIYKHAGDKQLQLQEPAHAASLYMHLLQTSVQRQHEGYTMLLSLALRQNPCCADTLDASAAAQLLHAAVLQFMSNEYIRTELIEFKVAAITHALCTLPAAQHISLEVYAVILQLSTHNLDLYTAVVKMPQAQKLSSRMLCDLLVAVTQRAAVTQRSVDADAIAEDLLRRVPAAHTLSQAEIKRLVLEALQRIEPADRVFLYLSESPLWGLQGVLSQLTVSSLMDLMQEAVKQRLQNALPLIMDIRPAAQLLTEQEGFAALVVTAIQARLGVYGIIGVLGRLEVQDLSTADAIQLFSAIVECGDRESGILNKLSALANVTADALGKLLQLCVKHAHCNGMQLLCEQPAADDIDADAILCLCQDILGTGMFDRGGSRLLYCLGECADPGRRTTDRAE